jgi:hypothetical protein
MAESEKPEIERHERRDSIEETIAEAKKAASIDTVHKDEGMKVLATYDGDLHWTPQEEKTLVRRIDFKLMPILILTYGLQYYDKAMLAQAVSGNFQHLDLLLTVLGNLWVNRGSGAYRRSISLRRFNLLPGIYLWSYPSNSHGPKISNRARGRRHCVRLGHCHDGDSRLL